MCRFGGSSEWHNRRDTTIPLENTPFSHKASHQKRPTVAEAICAAGDDRNDLPMIIGAGFGVAMGNARKEVQDTADHVVGCHESGGLLELVEILTSR